MVAALLLYALSYAPIYSMAHKRSMAESNMNAISYFYAPLTWVAVNTPLAGPIASYCNWWCALFGIQVYFDYRPHERD